MCRETNTIARISLTIDASFEGSTSIHLKTDDDCELEIERDSFAAYRDGEPTKDKAAITKQKVEQVEIHRLLEMLSELHIPIVPDDGVTGFDGTTYTLEFQGTSSCVSYTWWVKPPERWERLGEITRCMCELAGIRMAG